MAMSPSFERFVAVDWSGAVGERHRSIAVAEADAQGGPPRLIVPERAWTRGEVASLIDSARRCDERTLFGFDMCFGLPFGDDGYFPGDAAPPDAKSLWAEVAEVCASDPHGAAPSYVAHRRKYFWLGAADGPRRAFERLRAVERVDAERGGTPSPVAVLLGAAQCGKASLAGMRLLAGLGGVPVWPMDAVPDTGSVVVEIYCRIFAQIGGARGKFRTRIALDAALAKLGSDPCGNGVPAVISDHQGDALISAAGMRVVAAVSQVWSPPGLTPHIAATEGWTFGIV